MPASKLDSDPEFERRFRDAAASCSSKTEMAETLEITRDSVNKYLRKFKIDFREKSTEPKPEADPVEVEKQRATTQRQKSQVQDLAKRLGQEQSFREFLADLMREVAQRVEPPDPHEPPPVHSGTTSETLLLHLSDWHGYEQVKSERVLGLNRYDDPTMRRRIRNVIGTAIDLKNRLEKADWRFRKLVIACNGDFVSGTIHEAEKHSDAENVMLASYGVGRLLGMSIRDLSAHFDEIEVYGTSGNHGRPPDARKKQHKEPLRSWDTLIYLFAMTATEVLPNVRWHIPESYSVLYDIEGWTFYQGHGDDIKSWNSIPFYGINRMASNLNALMVAKGNPINNFLLGHFHNAASMDAAGGEYFVNGSLIGGTEFSVNGLGRCDKPKQYLMGVHRTKGVTHRWPILADEGIAGADEVAYPRPTFAGREVGLRGHA